MSDDRVSRLTTPPAPATTRRLSRWARKHRQARHGKAAVTAHPRAQHGGPFDNPLRQARDNADLMRAPDSATE
jgi:hypothetical protein